jgi:hypothetical protein
MKRTAPAAVTEQRVQLLRENIRLVIFQWVNRGLFGQHRLIFMAKLVFKLLQKSKHTRILHSHVSLSLGLSLSLSLI